jgi:hypothetical protein
MVEAGEVRWRKEKAGKDGDVGGDTCVEAPCLDPPRTEPVERGWEIYEVLMAVFRTWNNLHLSDSDEILPCDPILWLNMSHKFTDDEVASNGEDETAEGEGSEMETTAKVETAIPVEAKVTGELIADSNALSEVFYGILTDPDVTWSVAAGRALRFLGKIPMAAALVGDVDTDLEDWEREFENMITDYGDRYSPHNEVVIRHRGQPPGWVDLDNRLRRSYARIVIIVARNWALLLERDMENKFLERAVLDEMKDRGDRFHPAFFASGRVARAAGVDSRDLIRDEAEDEDEDDEPEEPPKRKRGRPRKTDPETAE